MYNCKNFRCFTIFSILFPQSVIACIKLKNKIQHIKINKQTKNLISDTKYHIVKLSLNYKDSVVFHSMKPNNIIANFEQNLQYKSSYILRKILMRTKK